MCLVGLVADSCNLESKLLSLLAHHSVIAPESSGKYSLKLNLDGACCSCRSVMDYLERNRRPIHFDSDFIAELVVRCVGHNRMTKLPIQCCLGTPFDLAQPFYAVIEPGGRSILCTVVQLPGYEVRLRFLPPTVAKLVFY